MVMTFSTPNGEVKTFLYLGRVSWPGEVGGSGWMG